MTAILFQILLAGFLLLALRMALRKRGTDTIVLVGIAVLMLTTTTNFPRVFPALTSATSAARTVAWAALVGLAVLQVPRLERVVLSPTLLAFYALLVSVVASALFNLDTAMDPTMMRDAIRTVVISGGIIVALAVLVQTERTLGEVSLLLALALFLVAASGPADRFLGAIRVDADTGGRVGGLRGQSNGLAYFATYGVPIFEAMRRLAATNRSRMLWMGAIATSCAAVLLSASRAGTVVFALALFLTLVRGRSLRLLLPVAGVIIFAVGYGQIGDIVSAFAGSPVAVAQRFQSLSGGGLDLVEGDLSLHTRFQMVSIGLADWSERPILGLGPWQFAGRLGINLHNSYVQALVELGIVGFVSYLLFIVAGLNSFRRTARIPHHSRDLRELNRALGLIALVACISQFFANALFDVTLAMIIGLGLATRAIALRTMRDEPQQQEPQPEFTPEFTPNFAPTTTGLERSR